MITTTEHSNPSNRSSGRRNRGFSLAETMIAVSVSTFFLAGVSSSYIFMLKSSLGAGNYYEMNQQSRRCLEQFSRDVRMTADVISVDPSNITIEVELSDGSTEVIDYIYESSNKRLLRETPTTSRVVLKDLESFSFSFYNLLGLATTSPLEVERIQFSAKAVRKVIEQENTHNNISAASKIRNRKMTN